MSSINVSNLANGVFNVVKTVTANATFDTTIRAIIQERVDSATGKYKIQYQDSVFYAFTEDTKTIYAKGTEVFVLVPENDFTQEKRIIGSVKKLGTEYAASYQYEQRYKKIGAAQFLIKESIQWPVVGEGYSQTISTVDINFLKYLQNNDTSGLWIEGVFTTSDSLSYQKNAQYGLQLQITLVNSEKIILEFSSNDFEGNPFSQHEMKQITVWSGVDWKKVKSIDKINSFASGFAATAIPTPSISVKEVKLYAVSTLTDAEIKSPRVELSTPQGLYVPEDGSIVINATLYINLQPQKDWKYYWFRENPLVGQTSKNYHAFGGPQWELINEYLVVDNNSTISNLDSSSLQVWHPSLKEESLFGIAGEFNSEQIKCVIVNPENEVERYEGIITIFNNSWINPYDIVVNNQDYSAVVTVPQDSDIVLSIITQENLDGASIQWYQKPLSELVYSLVKEQEGQTLEVSTNDIVKETSYCAVINGIQSKVVRVTIEAKQELYQLIIYNGNQIFQYDRNGRSPSHPAVTFPTTPLNLSFILYDNIKKDKVEESLLSWEWSWNSNSLIDFLGSTSGSSNNLTGGNPVSLHIKDAWSYETVDNQVTLTVKYNGQELIAQTAFTFSKEGDPGSTYQDITVVIQKNENSYQSLVYKGPSLITDVFPEWRIVTANNADMPFQGSVPSLESETDPWVLVSKYSENNKDYFGYYVQDATLIETIRVKGTPSKFVVYESDGLNPQYATWVFEQKKEDNEWETVEVQYKGPFSEETKNSLKDIIPAAFSVTTAQNNGLIPIEIWLNSIKVGQIVLYAFLNPYVFSTLDAGGSALKINNGESHILSQIALTGSREEDNTFTGLLIGMIGHTDKDKPKQQGLFTFTKGAQTSFIDALTGNAYFGDPAKPILSIQDTRLLLTLGDVQYECAAGEADAQGVIHLVLSPIGS